MSRRLLARPTSPGPSYYRVAIDHQAQLLNYLKATGIRVGLLVNFSGSKAEIKRVVLNLPEGQGG
ncbi:MAG: GxxExxY protein [Deltaproteobacteria bacterium]|nr:GxxExxY protein [Deltaproteobacteria bacterium]